jgi:uncharacterized protein YqfA (UPF0365 family)
MLATWKVKAYIEYEIEAESKEEAITRLGECIFSDLDDSSDIRDIAEVDAEQISDKGIDDPNVI